MAQIGHKSPNLTLAVYTDAGNRQHAATEHVGMLLRGLETAHNGTTQPEGAERDIAGEDQDGAEVQRLPA
jgi:hypothetical protein